MSVWTLGLIILLWRYIDEGKPRYLYMGALVLALAFATKETTFMVVGILGSYLLVATWRDWLPWLLRRPVSSGNSSGEPAGEYGYTPGFGFGYASSRRRITLSAFSRPGVFLLLLSTLLLPQATALVGQFQSALKSYGVVLAGTSSPVGAPAGDVLWTVQDVDITKGMVIAALVVIAALWFSTLVGLSWSRFVWLRCAAIFYSVWLLLYTTFFTNPLGLASGMWQSLGYWIVQQDVNRGDQPWYYYFVLAPIYETLPLIFSVVAVVYYAFRGDRFAGFLAYWTITTVLLYTWGRGEDALASGQHRPADDCAIREAHWGHDFGHSWSRVIRSGGLLIFPLTALLLYLVIRLALFNIERAGYSTLWSSGRCSP